MFGVSEVVRVEGNSVIFINREILTGPEDARICWTRFSNDNEEFQWNSKKYSFDNDNLWNTSVFYLFWFWELQSTKTGIGALKYLFLINLIHFWYRSVILYDVNYGTVYWIFKCLFVKHLPCLSLINWYLRNRLWFLTVAWVRSSQCWKKIT